MKLSLSQLEGKSFKEKLTLWAEEVVPYCIETTSSKIDRSFFAFQSEPKECPKVLILGLNPAGVCSYADQYKNEKWEIPNGMTVDVFVHQNPWYFGGKHYDEKERWNILEKLKITTSVNDPMKEMFSDIVYMNILYFNSKDFSEFQTFDKWQEVFDKCAEFTQFLILNIIKPERIVCLGIDNCFLKFIKNENHTKVIQGLEKSEIHCTDNKSISVYGITHPSARISNEQRATIGYYLSQEWFKTNISENMAATLKNYRIDNDIVLKSFENSITTQISIKEKKDKLLRFQFNDKSDKFKNLEIRITCQGYWGIRAADEIKGIGTNWNDNLTDKDLYISVLSKLDLNEDGTWLGKKDFAEYQVKSEEVQAKIEEDISLFIQGVNNNSEINHTENIKQEEIIVEKKTLVENEQKDIQPQELPKAENKTVENSNSNFLLQKNTELENVLNEFFRNEFHYLPKLSIPSKFDFKNTTADEWIKIISSNSNKKQLDSEDFRVLKKLDKIAQNAKIENGYIWVSAFFHLMAVREKTNSTISEGNTLKEFIENPYDLPYEIDQNNIKKALRDKNIEQKVFSVTTHSSEEEVACPVCNGEGSKLNVTGYFANGREQRHKGKCSNCNGSGKIKFIDSQGNSEKKIYSKYYQTIRKFNDETNILQYECISSSLDNMQYQPDYSKILWNNFSNAQLENSIVKLNKNRTETIIDRNSLSVSAILDKIGKKYQYLPEQNRETAYTEWGKKMYKGELACSLEQHDILPIIKLNFEYDKRNYSIYIFERENETVFIVNSCPHISSVKALFL
ncbi:MAG: hypothetical protein LBN95_06290 [Prevotellaceae bacterium]|jgi:hypothetical protein|nr:hypothetical protein [Prevotellaceae bacterium]